MYIQLVSVHGLIRGDRLEMGRDADTGGQVRYVLELARTLASFDEVDQVDLFTRRVRDKRVSEDYAQPTEELGPKCRLVRLPCGNRRYMAKEKLWPHLDDFVDAMIAFTRKEGRIPAFVHGHYADAGYVAKEVASAFGIPLVFTGHSLGRDKKAYLVEQGKSEEEIQKAFRMSRRIRAEEECLGAADLVVASTRHERDVQYGRYNNTNLDAIRVIPPGTGLDRFFPYYDYDMPGAEINSAFKQARVSMVNQLERFHVDDSKPLILALCRPDKRKNITSLVQAYGEDKELQAIANLAVFAGIRRSIEDMPEGERQVLTDILLMMDRYDLYGKMAIPKRHDSEAEVPELYRIAASRRGVFVNPAYVEPFGLTFIEASATGLPFVGTENGGPQDIKDNCDSGILVDVNDRKELAKAIRRILTDGELWEKYSRNGINQVREHYTWETHCKRYLKAVAEVTAKQVPEVRESDAHNEAIGRRMASLESMLVTDIDNTLLGDTAALVDLGATLEKNRGRIGLGVATGRHVDSAREVLEENGVWPLDLMITSVGTEIYYGADCTPDKGWASHIRAKWRREKVVEVLTPLPGIELQEDEKTQREFKVSFNLDPEFPPQDAIPAMHDALSSAKLSYNLVFSHGAYIDILPNRASKGKALRYVANKWNIPLERVATAGDSGNDTDMLRGRTAAIVVANHTSELDKLKRSGGRVYFARSSYAQGILEGLRHYGITDENPREAGVETA